ncbi:MAG: peptide/nickel transport system substrate-binding protein [Cellvibrionaceae bacterium]|jgi:peptide/nickel transport system substrate-binding protein
MTKEDKQIKEQMYEVHPRIPDAFTALKEGRISRREFIRFATLLGMSAALATACSTPAAPVVEEAPAEVVAEEEVVEEVVEEEMAEEEMMDGIQRGGTLTMGAQLQLLDHPARLSWVEGANVVRQVAEYLTLTDPDNITTPHLLESWEANADVSEWTLNIRKGIKFNNGDELDADDVMFNFSQWLDPEVGSSMLGLLSYLDGMNSVERVDDYTIKLTLTSPNIGVPEHLFHYPAAIMHRSFEGDFIQQPIGTGPFTLTEFTDGERAVLTRREDYWQMGEDGASLPYLDEVVYVSIDKDASIAGLQSGQVDSFYNPRPADWLALKDNSDMVVQSASTAQTLILRMRVDLEPWNDVRVRNALRKIQNREKILSLAYFGEGDLGVDAHVAPVHPAYDPRPIPEYDPEGAKALLEEWAAETGASLPLRATIVTKNDEGEQEYAEALKEDAAGSGFEFDLDITEAGGYWDRWVEVPLGITAWTHRPLDTMVIPLAYIADADGVPVPWNETRWVDDEFSAILKEAEATLDVTARREKIGQLMDIMQERGPIGLAFFKSSWRIHSTRVHNLPGHPTSYDLLNETWVSAA